MPPTDLRRLYALAPRYDALRHERPLGAIPAGDAKLDGQGFAYWLIVVEGTSYRKLSATAKRRLRSWVEGRPATLAAADRIVCEAKVPLSLIPAALVIREGKRKPASRRAALDLPPDERREAIRRWRKGGRPKRDALIRELCAEVGVETQTIWRWANEGLPLDDRRAEAVRRWRQLHDEIQDHTALAREYGITARTLQKWAKREDAANGSHPADENRRRCGEAGR